MSDPSHVNRVLAANCENCRVTDSQNTDGSTVTKFSYEFCLHESESEGFVGETPLFSTGRTGSKLDWHLKFGPDRRLNLQLLRWDGCDGVKVHVVCCWKLPVVETGCIAINENLDPRSPVPSLWCVKMPAREVYTPQRTDYKLLLDISMEDRVRGRAEYVSQYLASALKDGRFSDVTIAAAGRRFPVHRVIISRCPYILGNGDIDGDEIILNGVDPGILEMVLEFLYTGRLKNVEESRLKALLATATEWSILDLQQLCEDLISRSRNVRESQHGITLARSGNDDVQTLQVDIL